MALHSTSGQWPKTTKATQLYLKVKKWNILQWPSQSPDFNRFQTTEDKTKRQKDPQTNNNWSQLQQRPGKASQSIWWCPWVPDLSQSLPAKDSQQNIKNEHIIYDYNYFSNYIWAPRNGGGGGGCVYKWL